MRVPIQIIFRGFPHSDAVEEAIRRHAAKFEALFDNITRCRVTAERAAHGQRQGTPYEVRVDLRVPGEEIVAAHAHEDIYVAVRDACEAAERRLQEYTDRLHREVKPHDGRGRGPRAEPAQS